MRKSKFDDFILYCPERDKIFVGRRDVGWGGKWQWFISDFDRTFSRPFNIDDFIEIGREPEMSMFND